jgi:hypothetical protein
MLWLFSKQSCKILQSWTLLSLLLLVLPGELEKPLHWLSEKQGARLGYVIAYTFIWVLSDIFGDYLKSLKMNCKAHLIPRFAGSRASISLNGPLCIMYKSLVFKVLEKAVIQLQVLVNYARSSKEAEEVSKEVSMNVKRLTEMLCFSFLDGPWIIPVWQLY